MQWARRRIAEAKRTGATELDLEIEGLERIPEEIAGLTVLKKLYLRNTLVSDLMPIVGMTGIATLAFSRARVSALTPIVGMLGLTTLDLRGTPVPAVELRHLARKPGLVPRAEADPWEGVRFADSAAAREDARLGEIAGIKDPRERTLALFDYLGFDERGEVREEDASLQARLQGPILSDALSDVTKGPEKFEATALEEAPDRAEDDRYRDLIETLGFAAEKLGGADVQNRIGRLVAESFADYARVFPRKPVNARLLNCLAEGIRAAITDPDMRASLDAFDESKVLGFLAEHDTLIRDYHASALRGPQFEVETNHEVLMRELFPKLGAARDILRKADEDGLFAPSVSDALEMLHRRAEGARKRLVTTGDEAERQQAIADLRRNSLLVTA